MPITRENLLSKLDLAENPTNAERKEKLFRLTGVWAEARGKASNNYQAVAPVTERIQSMDVDLSHLRKAISVCP